MLVAALRAMVSPQREKAMRVVKIEVFRDDEAGVWCASSSTDCGIITEAETIEALRERLKLLVPDMLELDGPLRIDIDVQISDIVQAALV